MRDSEYNCAAASSEYNDALRAREYTPAREYGTAEQNGERKRHRTASVRQRALMQATAAVMAAVVVSAADTPRRADTSAAAGEWSEQVADPVTEPDSGSILGGLFGEPEDAGIVLTEEQKAFLDELYAACLAEDDAKIHALSHTPMLEEVVALGDFLYDGTQVVSHMIAGTPALAVEYYSNEHAAYRRVFFYLDGLDDQAFGRIILYNSSLNDVGD